MSRIDRVEIHEFRYVVENIGRDAGGFNFAYDWDFIGRHRLNLYVETA